MADAKNFVLRNIQRIKDAQLLNYEKDGFVNSILQKLIQQMIKENVVDEIVNSTLDEDIKQRLGARSDEIYNALKTVAADVKALMPIYEYVKTYGDAHNNVLLSHPAMTNFATLVQDYESVKKQLATNIRNNQNLYNALTTALDNIKSSDKIIQAMASTFGYKANAFNKTVNILKQVAETIKTIGMTKKQPQKYAQQQQTTAQSLFDYLYEKLDELSMFTPDTLVDLINNLANTTAASTFPQDYAINDDSSIINDLVIKRAEQLMQEKQPWVRTFIDDALTNAVQVFDTNTYPILYRTLFGEIKANKGKLIYTDLIYTVAAAGARMRIKGLKETTYTVKEVASMLENVKADAWNDNVKSLSIASNEKVTSIQNEEFAVVVAQYEGLFSRSSVPYLSYFVATKETKLFVPKYTMSGHSDGLAVDYVEIYAEPSTDILSTIDYIETSPEKRVDDIINQIFKEGVTKENSRALVDALDVILNDLKQRGDTKVYNKIKRHRDAFNAVISDGKLPTLTHVKYLYRYFKYYFPVSSVIKSKSEKTKEMRLILSTIDYLAQTSFIIASVGFPVLIGLQRLEIERKHLVFTRTQGKDYVKKLARLVNIILTNTKTASSMQARTGMLRVFAAFMLTLHYILLSSTIRKVTEIAGLPISLLEILLQSANKLDSSLTAEYLDTLKTKLLVRGGVKVVFTGHALYSREYNINDIESGKTGLPIFRSYNNLFAFTPKAQHGGKVSMVSIDVEAELLASADAIEDTSGGVPPQKTEITPDKLKDNESAGKEQQNEENQTQSTDYDNGTQSSTLDVFGAWDKLATNKDIEKLNPEEDNKNE